MVQRVLILNGPNLNMLGKREPEIYGTQTLSDLETEIKTRGAVLNFEIDFRQTNHEGELVTWIQQACDDHAAIIINPAAYSHTSIAIHDALLNFEGPIIEVHLSNIHTRESFRQHSYVSPVASGVIVGLGGLGYLLALDAVATMLSDA